jgi:hypothetical protein
MENSHEFSLNGASFVKKWAVFWGSDIQKESFPKFLVQVIQKSSADKARMR